MVNSAKSIFQNIHFIFNHEISTLKISPFKHSLVICFPIFILFLPHLALAAVITSRLRLDALSFSTMREELKSEAQAEVAIPKRRDNPEPNRDSAIRSIVAPTATTEDADRSG